ncbi:alkene reductase [Streptomyces scopuliridis]|uniref:alkene reductase n=1 Tax=Streptomyces scopuliridis TaxID=452529 RepID=UPI002DD9B1DA|nr:alkene reductase [Streptomyces scopuliridis]WSB31563.1 alkene reductase [Streptomyces scopuliridis]
MTTGFDPLSLAGVPLNNRVVMLPMTRSRAHGPGQAPTEATAVYYAQRATAGLIVSEGIQPSVVGQGYPSTPGLHSDAQVEAWRRVTDAVHAKDGVIFAQLMHTGRIGHPSLLPDGLISVAPSAVAADTKVFTAEGLQPCVTPKELTPAEIEQTIADFVSAARNAIAAGFDGVEIHGANGYLIQQFLSDNANLRTDEWGGTTQGRIRFGVEVAKAVTEAIGAHRVGFRISPGNPFNDIVESDLPGLYGELLTALSPLGLAYVHLMEGPDRELSLQLRKQWQGTFILNPFTHPNPTGLDALGLVEDGTTDAVSFGALFISNPDLPRRLQRGGPFATPDPATFYGGDERGYTDYPTLD